MKQQRGIAAADRSNQALTFGIVLLIGIYGLTNSFQSVVMNRVVDAYQLTGGAQGIMSSMINIGCLLAFFAAPLLQGRLKKTTMLLIACLLVAVSFFLLGASRLYAVMVAASVLTGIGFGWLDTNCNAVMVDLHMDRSASYLGLLHGGFGVGGLIAPLLITALLAVITWHSVSFIMAAVVFLAGLVFFLLLAFFSKGSAASAPERPLSFSTARSFFLRKTNVLMLLASMFYAVMQSGLLIWLVRYMTLRYEAETLGSAALSIYWVCATLSRFFAPRIPMRPLKLFLVSTFLAFALQIAGVLSGSPVVMCIMVGAVGLVTGHCIPMLLSEISKGQQGNTALATSATLIAMCVMRILVPIAMGAIAEAANISIAMLTPGISGALAGLFAILVLTAEKREGPIALAK